MKGKNMMRFITITNKLIEAVLEFCMTQCEFCCDYTESEVKAMLDMASSELKKIRNGVLPVAALNRYDLFVSGGYSDEILPPDEEANGILYREMVHLASFDIDEYGSSDCPYKCITRGYDIVYDMLSGRVLPVYKITISDNDVTSVYRVESELFEGFCSAEFIISLSLQLADKLKNGAAYLGKVADMPCA
jgi:hypothetical protein